LTNVRRPLSPSEEKRRSDTFITVASANYGSAPGGGSSSRERGGEGEAQDDRALPSLVRRVARFRDDLLNTASRIGWGETRPRRNHPGEIIAVICAQVTPPNAALQNATRFCSKLRIAGRGPCIRTKQSVNLISEEGRLS
jgi:hypothetical protein